MRQSSRRLTVLATMATLLVGLIGAPVAGAVTILHVPADHATIQGAIDAASPGDTVLVEAGTYVEHLTIQEDITVESADGPDVTIIDGAHGDSAVILSAVPGESPTIRGFTIRNGGFAGNPSGGGILTSGGPALIEGNHIVGNASCSGGSGIEAADSAATIKDNLIEDNHQSGCTGGVGGGGIEIRLPGTVKVLGNIIRDNSHWNGGGISMHSAGAVVIDGNIISGNHGGEGGGIWGTSAPTSVITNNVFAENSANSGGGAYFTDMPRIVNNTFVNNTASFGSAVNSGGVGAASRFTNNVVWGASTTATVICGGMPITDQVSTNDVVNGSGPAFDGDCAAATGANGNVSVDPGFWFPDGGDYHLRSDSALIDAGSNADAPATDFDGDARPFDGDEDTVATADIGYDESIDPLLVQPPHMDFSNVIQSLPAAQRAFTLTNFGGSPVTIGLGVVGSDAGDFSIGTETCTGAPLAVDASCTIMVGFTPTAIGPRDAFLTIAGPAPLTRRIPLAGTGDDPVGIAPASLDFGSVAAGATAAPKTITVTNLGAVPMSVTTVAFDGANLADFSVDEETCTGSPIAAHASCTVTVGFSPSAVGTRAANLSIEGPDPVNTRGVPLSGIGFDSISVTPSTVAFGGVPQGSPSTPKTVTLTNSFPTAVSVTTVVLGGTNSIDFSITGETCTTAPIAPTASCTVTIVFKPTALGARTGSLTISGPAPVGSRAVTLTGAGGPPLSGVGWGSTLLAGRAYTWNGGSALGRTVQSGSQRLHIAYATDRVGGAWSTNTSHRAGVYYVRTTSGSSYSTPKRLNPSTQTAIRVAAAASGSRVYVAWVSQTRLTNLSPTQPRVVYVRVNTSHGGGTHWRSPVALSFRTTRADYPSVAASDPDAYVAYTKADTGSIAVAITRNRGVTWITKSVGLSTNGDAFGRSGVPTVAVSGSTVAVAWISDASGTVKARVSTNRGKSWGTIVVVGSGATSAPQIAVRGSRVVVTWATIEGVLVRQRISGTWGTPLVVADLSDVSDPVPYAPAVVLQGSTRIAVTWSEASQSADESDLRWVESKNGGATWYEAQTLASAASSSARRANDWASVSWPSEGTRYVLWNGWTPGTNDYRLYLRKGSGTPIGPTSVAAVQAASDGGFSTTSGKDQPPLSIRDRTSAPTGVTEGT